MTSIMVPLLRTGESKSGYHTLNDEEQGQVYRADLLDDGETLITQAKIIGIANGNYDQGGLPATLIIFAFRFTNNAARDFQRFSKATITLKFEDAEQPSTRNDPEVKDIFPKGTHHLNKSTRERDITFRPKVGIKAEIPGGPGTETGVEWEVKEQVSDEYHASITGVKRVQRKPNAGKPNTVVWTLKENSHKRSGLPTLLRACVLLQLPSSRAFKASLEVDTDVDFLTEFRRMAGLERFDRVDPFTIIPETAREEDMEGGEELDLKNLSSLVLEKFCGISIATTIKILDQ
ncbi:hypothetical protein QBC44DRAFT_346311 [Cladorrhinum sp. PSN332]|nr:hypothetical protein QBC44DRAFT_346311 [Cladorrhinum sp. PSN332]